MAAAVLPAAFAVAADRAAPPPCGLRCVLVEVTRVNDEAYVPKVMLTGSIEPKFSSNVGFRVSGRIERRLADVGDHVAAGQVLAELDAREQRANLDAAKAGLASAQALLTQASANFDRQTELLKSGFTTRQAYDQAQSQLRTQGAAVESAEAAVGTAQERLDDTALKAGAAGIITARNAEIGQVVPAGQTVYTIAQDGARDAVFDVYEALLTNPPSENAQIFLQSDPRIVTTGTVREVSPTVDTATGTVRIKIAIDAVPEQMSLGAVVVGVGSLPPRRAIALSRTALFRWRDQPAVWLYDPETHKVTPQVIKIDRYAGNDLVLSDGVKPGDMVVTAGIQFLWPGQVVELSQRERKP
jgi:RND family efflux transporter MFP subunit